jgi:hypothetical protein
LLSELFSVKVKVIEGVLGLWFGDNIAILSMVKRAHLLFYNIIIKFFSLKFNYFMYFFVNRVIEIRSV